MPHLLEVQNEHKELITLTRQVNAANAASAARAVGDVPVPGTTGEPIPELPMPEAGKKWQDRKVEFPPKVPPYNTLGVNYSDVVERLNLEFTKGARAGDFSKGIGRGFSLEEVQKAYMSWRENWGDMVREWLPEHAGRGELPLLLKVMKELGPISSPKDRLVKNDDGKPFGPGNARWTVSRMRLSSKGYPYAKAKEAFKRLEDSGVPLDRRWRRFKDFIDEVGFPPDRNGGPPINLVPKDPSLPIGKGNVMWAPVSKPLTRKDPAYLRTYMYWGELQHQTAPEMWPSSWATFQGFAADVGPRPSYLTELDKIDGRKKFRLAFLRRRNPMHPHGALPNGTFNSYWDEESGEDE